MLINVSKCRTFQMAWNKSTKKKNANNMYTITWEFQLPSLWKLTFDISNVFFSFFFGWGKCPRGIRIVCLFVVANFWPIKHFTESVILTDDTKWPHIEHDLCYVTLKVFDCWIWSEANIFLVVHTLYSNKQIKKEQHAKSLLRYQLLFHIERTTIWIHNVEMFGMILSVRKKKYGYCYCHHRYKVFNKNYIVCFC